MATAALPSASSAANHTMLDEYIYGNHMENGSSGVAEDNGSPVLEDDMLLGAEAEHLDGERPKSFHQSLCKGKMTHMDSVSSDGSRYSIDQLLHDRKPDPEEMLRNLGFASSSKLESRRRVPVRFLQTPSRARGIILEQLVKTNSELKECVEASKEMMMPQGSGLHSFKTATKTVRMIARLSHMQKHKPQDNNNIPKTPIEPMEVTSPDGNYKYMTILDPENSLYLAKQGHYKKLSRQSKFKFANAMPDILSPTVSQDEHQKLPHKVDKTLLKSEASICNDKDVKPKRLEFEGENIVAPLEIVEASKENVDSHLDINSNLRLQPVTQLSWQPAGCLIRPMAQNCGAFTLQYLQHFSHQHNQSEDRNAELTDVDCDVANKRLDVSDVSSEIEADERTSTDQSKSYLSDNGVGERETSSDEQSLKSTLFKGVGSGSPTGNLDQGDLDMTQQGARDGNSQHSDEGTSIPKVGRKRPEAESISSRPSEVGEKQWLYRRSNWRACPNFIIQVEPTEGEVVPEKPTNSFDMEEIQSADEDVVDDILPVFKRETSKGSLVRSGSGHSDSSGFTEFDEESEVTVCFARIPSKDSVKESYGDSSDSSCTVCGSLEHDGHTSLEHDRQSLMERDQESDQTLYTSPSSVAMQILNSASATSSGKTVTIATGDHHDNGDDVRNTAETQQVTPHESVESKDVISANVPSVYTSAEVSTTSNHQLTLSSQSHSQQSVTVDDASPTTNTSSVTDPQSQTGPCHECQQKPVSSVMDTVSTCRDAEIDRVGLGSDRKLMSHPANDQDDGAGIIFYSREMGTREEQTLATVVIHSQQQHLVEEVTKVQQQHLADEVQQLQQQHVEETRQAQPQHMVEKTSRAQPQHLVEEAKQVQQQHLVDEVKQVQQDVVRYKSSLQMLETQSTEIMSKHISEQFRDELCELQQLRSDIFQEVVKLEHLLAVRMGLVIAGNRVQLHASETNHRHIVLPMVDLLREQICHHNIIDALEQSMTQPPDSDDTVVDATVDDTGQTPLPQSDDVVSYQMMFTQAMDGLKVALLADIRSTIHSEMEPLRVQMQEFGGRLKRLESVVTNGEVVAPHAGTQHDNIDNGVT